MPAMHRRTALLFAAILPLAWPTLVSAASAEPPRISGPLSHENLAIYLIHGPSESGPVPLTLAEGLAKGVVEVRETGSVNQLEIENFGTDDVFIQSGDIVKGGQQDRVLMVSLLLPARSGKMPIGAFCVEQGRWTRRGVEDVKRFASSDAAVPSKELRLAMQAPKPASPAVAGIPSPSSPVDDPRLALTQRMQPHSPDETSSRQQDVWQNVARAQQRLASALGGPVASAQSASSLQLALENDKLAAARTAYVEALRPQAEKDDDVVGYVVAINGRLSSADIYPSNGLFRKMWAKQLAAAATEAVAGKQDAAAAAAPASEAVQVFLADAETGKAQEKTLTAGVKLHTRDAPKTVYLETSRASGAMLHRNYLAK